MQKVCGHPESPVEDGVGEELVSFDNKALKLYATPRDSCRALGNATATAGDGVGGPIQ